LHALAATFFPVGEAALPASRTSFFLSIFGAPPRLFVFFSTERDRLGFQCEQTSLLLSFVIKA
jgi:hypothetical protein